MKKNRRFFCLLLVFMSIVCFDCDQDSGSGKSEAGEGTITVTVNGSEKFYFSLKTGKEVTGADINTNKWDIGFQRPRTVFTNSGVTATVLESGGNGSVWYTEKTDFDAVVLNDAVKSGNLSEYFTDKSKWFYSMSRNQNITYNVINFTGYETGLGTEGDPFRDAEYNKKQFYIRGEASSYPVTNVVYIVRHGNGSNYSKIQISQYEYGTSSDTYVVKYENF